MGNETFPAVPMRRDTFTVRPNGNIVLRFRADNPDKFPPKTPSNPPNPQLTPSPPRVWLFHCHIEWHIASGLVATFIESPLSLQSDPNLTIPPSHLSACTSQGTPTRGTAAGNTENVFDLEGANKPPGPLPAGFTWRGIVALVFSVVSGVVGIATIAW